MMANKSFIPGYVIGGSVFMIILPIIFYFGSQKIDSYFGAFLVGDSTVKLFLSLIMLLTGLLFSFWSIVIQRKIGKGGPLDGYKVEVSPRTKKLNTTGPYKYTRNPMLFGTCLFYFSLSLFFNSLAFILLASLFTVIMVTLVKNMEEKRLLADFGEEYEVYRKRTSLFIPLPP
ncbi:MAG: isoprenylcysteine carboxylmethyltransferase family protein, partial [Candidatus Nealsonbacteria bacterium]|nr:isoprenylcysteine carboxylmethyltransferase family protein [Candidatus Nealsonbacteria bacterium]